MAKQRKRKGVKLEDLERLGQEDLRYRFIRASRFLENIREIETEMKKRAEQKFLEESNRIHKKAMEERDREDAADKEENKENTQ